MKATTRHGLLLAAALVALFAGFFAARSLATTTQAAVPAPQPTMVPF